MSRVIDLAGHRPVPVRTRLTHPAGVTLPFDGASDAALIAPEVRKAIRAGAYSAGLIELLPNAVQPGDRVLVIGAGLGVVSTLIAKRLGIERVIALEANVALMPYLQRVHSLNGVPWVATLNAVPALRTEGRRVPFFARRDVRNSSLLPGTAAWHQAMMIPLLDLNLLVADEEISLIISEIPVACAGGLAQIEPGSVERIAVSDESSPSQPHNDAGLVVQLAHRGFAVEQAHTATLFSRAAVKANAGSRIRNQPIGQASPSTRSPLGARRNPATLTTHEIQVGVRMRALRRRL